MTTEYMEIHSMRENMSGYTLQLHRKDTRGNFPYLGKGLKRISEATYRIQHLKNNWHVVVHLINKFAHNHSIRH